MNRLALINELFGMPPNASEHGYQIDHIIEFCHWFMGCAFRRLVGLFPVLPRSLSSQPPSRGRSRRCNKRHFHSFGIRRGLD